MIEVLNEVLATEIVCTLRYKRHYYTARGIHRESIAQEFLEHAAEEQAHADRVAERITQLRGDSDFNPDTLTRRSHAEYKSEKGLIDMIKEDLIAERIAIESCREIIRWLGDADPTTRRMMEEVFAKEEEHADEMLTLLEGVKGD